ncbi:MAG: Crp/Fnr family transcriptional regulator [Oceanicaulis sp.]
MTRRLRALGALTDDHQAALASLPRRERRYPRGAVLRRADELNTRVFCVVEGWALRYRLLDDGARQILSLMMPGDMCDMQALIGADSDHFVVAATDLVIEECAASEFQALLQDDETLAEVFLRSKLQEESILREQVVRLGQLKAPQRVLHLVVELAQRQKMTGVDEPWRLQHPLGREMLADFLGLSPVHVSRSLALLSRLELIDTRRGCVSLPDPDRAAEYCQFDPSYLSVRTEGCETAA